MDNLNSNKSVAVQNIIFHYGHTVVYRALYYACDGPIEYIFNTIQSILRSNLANITIGDDIIRELSGVLFVQWMTSVSISDTAFY